jgi:hypothetical protein
MPPRKSDFLVNEKIYFSWRLEKAIFRKPKYSFFMAP